MYVCVCGRGKRQERKTVSGRRLGRARSAGRGQKKGSIPNQPPHTAAIDIHSDCRALLLRPPPMHSAR